MIIIEYAFSIFFIGVIVYGVIGGWRGFKQRQEEERGMVDNRFFGENEPFYWMTIGSWKNHHNSDHPNNLNVHNNTNDSYDYDDHIDF